MNIIAHLGKLRLYCGGVDASIVEDAFDLFGNAHIVVQPTTAYVSRGDDAIPSQLPDMKFMYLSHSVNLSLIHISEPTRPY